jgi:hypothetical protein
MNAWEALTVVLVVLTVVAGVVVMFGWVGFVALQARRDKLEFDAWRLQLAPPREREVIDVRSR